MLETEDVIAAFKAILLRNPGDGLSVKSWIDQGFSRITLQRALLESKEFILQQNRQNIIEHKSRKLDRNSEFLDIISRFNISPINRWPGNNFSITDKEKDIVRKFACANSPRTIIVIGDYGAELFARVLAEEIHNEPVVIISNNSDLLQLNYAVNLVSPPIIRIPLAPDYMIKTLNNLKIIPDVFIISAKDSSVSSQVFEQGHEKTLLFVEKGANSSYSMQELQRIVPPHMGEIIELENISIITNMLLEIPVEYVEKQSQEQINKENKLALVAIVKNEEDMIESMIMSASGMADLVVIADTGSSDKTCDVARAASAKIDVPIIIVDIEFRDFSQARNEAIKAVPDYIDWIIALDADEYIVDSDKKKLTDLIANSSHDCWCLPRYNFLSRTNTSALLAYPDRQARLFKNSIDGSIYYVNAVHETLTGYKSMGSAPSNLEYIGLGCGGPHIHHIGMFKSDKKAAERALQNDKLTMVSPVL